MSELKQQIEEFREKLDKIKQMYEGHNLSQSIKDKLRAYEMFGNDVLGLLADYEKEEENIRGALAETTTKLIAKIEYLEREIANMKEVEKESVCIPKNKLEDWLEAEKKLDAKDQSIAENVLRKILGIEPL